MFSDHVKNCHSKFHRGDNFSYEGNRGDDSLNGKKSGDKSHGGSYYT